MSSQRAVSIKGLSDNRAPMEGATILLVNDQQDARTLIRRTLQRAGFEHILEASDGRAAIQELRRITVDMVITDVHMPHLDGWRLARMVRSGVFRCASDIPIIVVSATFSERIAEITAREFGVTRFLPLQDRKALPAAVQECLAEHSAHAAKPKLLVIEDHPETADLASRILKGRFDVEWAADGASGLELWQARRHALVLLDVMLPGISGIEVLRRMLEAHPSQAVVIMTADGTMERAEQLMLQGACDFVAKPFHAEELRRVCEIAVRREDYMVTNEQFAQRLRALRASEEAHRKVAEAHQRLLDNLGTVVFELDSLGRIQFVNRAWTRITGLEGDQALGRDIEEFFHPGDQQGFRAALETLLTGQCPHVQSEARLVTKQGSVRWIEIAVDAWTDTDGATALVGRLDDITERKQAQQELEYLSMHDPLTGLFNRRYCDTALAHLCATSARGAGPHALLYIDLDHFKAVNDTLGHQKGDRVLSEIAFLLASRARRADILGRLGGDEFALLLVNATANRAEKVANEVREMLDAYRVDVDGTLFDVTCSIGISIIDGSLASPDEYMIQADKALYVAKRRGRNLAHLYSPEDREAAELLYSMDWVRRVRDAIAEGHLELYLQPIVHLATGDIGHFEALVRLNLPGREGAVLPGEFIPALEQLGQMAIVDHWVIERAGFLLRHYPQIRCLAVNLSGQAFRDEHLIPLVRQVISAQAIAADRLVFEITETASVAHMQETQRIISELRGLGCGFALDDFGTGFSTFTYLKHLPADYLKLDGSFVRRVSQDQMDRELVRSINDIAHTLGKKTIAERVEDASTLAVLKDLGVDFAQGYHLGVPGPVDAFGLRPEGR